MPHPLWNEDNDHTSIIHTINKKNEAIRLSLTEENKTMKVKHHRTHPLLSRSKVSYISYQKKRKEKEPAC